MTGYRLVVLNSKQLRDSAADRALAKQHRGKLVIASVCIGLALVVGGALAVMQWLTTT